MNPRGGTVKTEEVRRPLSLLESFYNALVTFCNILLGPLLDILAFSTTQGCLYLGSLIQWARICAGKSCHKGRMKSKDLVTGPFLGQGCSGIFYETTWSRSPESTMRLARKDFPGVESDIFESEVVRLLELKNHPKIVKTLGWTVDSRSCSLVMEHMIDDLSSIMRREKEALRRRADQPVSGTSLAPFKLLKAMDIALQIATGMEYLHDQGIAHGDLKPNNVLVEYWDEDLMLVKLADFGLIETKRRTTLISQRALCFRMIEWSAPELFEDYFGSISEDLDYLWTTSPTVLDVSTSSASNYENCPKLLMIKADSYSFALTCTYILSGQVWDAQLSPNELRRQILSSALRPKLPPECPEKLASLLSKCWDTNPIVRPTFSVIRNKLQEIVKEQREQEVQRDTHNMLQEIVNEQHEIRNKLQEFLKEHSNIHNKSQEIVKEQQEIRNKLQEIVKEHSDIHNKSQEIVKEHSDIHNKSQEIVKEQQEIRYKLQEIVKEQSDIHNKSQEIVKEQLEIHNKLQEIVKEQQDPQQDFDADCCSSKPMESLELITRVSEALRIIEDVTGMSSKFLINKHQCERLAGRVGATGEKLKEMANEFVGSKSLASSNNNTVDYPAFDLLLTVLRKAKALLSKYIEVKASIPSVLTRTENRKAFEEIHADLDTMNSQFHFEDSESTSESTRRAILTADADKDLEEMSESLDGLAHSDEPRQAAEVVSEKTESTSTSDHDNLPSYLTIDPAMVEISGAVRDPERKSEHDPVEVEEASARHVYFKFLPMSADHFGVCKPGSRESSSYLAGRDLIKYIVDDNKLRYDLLLELPSHVVGMEDKFMEVCEKLKAHSVVGLVGVGGIGKTTLSKYFYNRRKSDFDKFVFLEDVKSSDIQVSQKRLFDKLCGGSWDAEDVSVQMEKIRQCITKKKVLVVVDDVGNVENMKALKVDAFKDGKEGSRVIVTTRGRDILRRLVSKEAVIGVEGLNEEQSLALFTDYAFEECDESVRVQLDGLAKKIAKACGGLPLSLEVMGQFLRMYNDPSEYQVMSVWENALDKLKEADPLDGSERRLWASVKMSYDDLSTSYQKMFLDFACIMSELRISTHGIGVEGQTIVRIWDDIIGVEHLINRSLMKWSDDKRTLVMHDQVRDWGRRMVRHLANGNIANMTRIWERDEGLQFIEQNNTSGGLQGLVLRMISSKSHEDEDEIHCKENDLQSTCRLWALRLLYFEGSGLPVVEYYVGLCSRELRWLSLNDTRITEKSIHNLGSFQKLRVLQMRRCKSLLEVPRGIGRLSSLTELDLSCCEGLKSLPDEIGNLGKLQVLKLGRCTSLLEVPRGIGRLSYLNKLDISDCSGLKSLPDEIGDLGKLQVLKLGRCTQLLEVPRGIGRLSCLTKLSISCCYELKSLPDEIGNLGKLQVLKVGGCTKLLEVPRGIGRLSCLTELDLSCCYRLTSLPDEIGDLGKLQVLKVVGCTSLLEVPRGIGRFSCLTELDISGCYGLKSLPDEIGDLGKLQILKVVKCASLLEVPRGIGRLSYLTELDISECNGLKSLPDEIGDLGKLQVLKLGMCKRLLEVPRGIGRLSCLIKFDISYCSGLMSLPNEIGNLGRLQVFKLRKCTQLLEVPRGIGRLSYLTKLDISDCSGLKSLPNEIGDLGKLQVLKMHGCTLLLEVPRGIGRLSSLTELDISCCYGLKSLPDEIGNLGKLQVLKLGKCTSLLEVPRGIGRLSYLNKLDISDCSGLKSLPDEIGDLGKLQVLKVHGCTLLLEVPRGIGRLSSLTELDISGCGGLKRLPDEIDYLGNLQVLHMDGCYSLLEVPRCISRFSW